MKAVTVLLALTLAAVQAAAQNPLRHPLEAIETRYAAGQPVIRYTLRADSTAPSGYDVTITIRNAPDTFRLALATHPEYDDEYWRHVANVRLDGPRSSERIVREDSAVWRVVAPGGQSVVRYRMQLPPQEGQYRSGWKPFLTPTGGLVGGIQSFMYVVGAELAPSYVTVDIPDGWDVATGLEPTTDPRTFFAPSVNVLIESPLLVGRFKSWRFAVDGVPHRVVYWPLPNAQPFDTTAFVAGLEHLAQGAIALFGRAPYRDYTFIVQDGAYGSLEHWNSVAVGAPSADLARDMKPFFADAAHEFFHTWNLLRIHPSEYAGQVDHRPAPRSRGLWWAEGITIYYADLLSRRGGVPTFDSTRLVHLQNMIARYLANPGNARLAPETVSVVTYGTPPGALGDYSASPHLQGEVLGTMIDFLVRDATNGRRSLDDVIRLMLERFGGERGYAGRDIDRTVAQVCGCRIQEFFDRHVHSGNAIDIDRYLALLGLRTRVTWSPALGRDQQPQADLRVYAWMPPGETHPMLLVTNPRTVWARAGFHTGDRIVAVDGAPIASVADFRAILTRLRIGDSLAMTVNRPSGPYRGTVAVTGYDRPTVRVEEIPEATARQRALLTAWLRGE
jgi:predicted metalloprotease with PDZ domain